LSDWVFEIWHFPDEQPPGGSEAAADSDEDAGEASELPEVPSS
jgi:hypothetical protein